MIGLAYCRQSYTWNTTVVSKIPAESNRLVLVTYCMVSDDIANQLQQQATVIKLPSSTVTLSQFVFAFEMNQCRFLVVQYENRVLHTQKGTTQTRVKLADNPLSRKFKNSHKEQTLAKHELNKITSRKQNQVTKQRVQGDNDEFKYF